MMDCYCEKHVVEAIRQITAEVLFKAAEGGWAKDKDTHYYARVAKLMYTASCAHKSGCKKVAEFLVVKA